MVASDPPVFQFIAGLFDGERPIDFVGSGVAPGLQCQRFLFETFLGADALVQALAGKGGGFDFDHVKPAAVLRPVVKFKFMAQRPAVSTARYLYKTP